MWHYFWGHNAYHLMRLNELHVRKYLLIPVLFVLGLISMGPQIYVLSIQNWYVMHCPFPISNLMYSSIFLSLIMLGFVVIFSLAVEVNSTIKLFFFLYGMVDFTYGILYIHYVHKIYVCMLAAREMYTMCAALGGLTSFSFMFFLCLGPCWLLAGWVQEAGQSDASSLQYQSVWLRRLRTIASFPCFQPIRMAS